jgi:hypothetical protein
MVMPGAFRRTLGRRGLRRIPMLFQHDPAEPIGVWLALVEDHLGLRAAASAAAPSRRPVVMLRRFGYSIAGCAGAGLDPSRRPSASKTRVNALMAQGSSG